MAPSPPPSPSPSHSSPSNKLDYYYFVVGLALVAIVLLVTNAIAVGCCAWFRQFLTARGLAPYDPSQEEVRRWIPSRKYRKKDRAGGEEGEGGTLECAVCLSAFDEGEEVRELPPCGHVFHAACIDMWLNSHTSCPVCRSSVLPTPLDSMEMSARFQSHDNLLPTAATSSTGGGGAGRYV